MGKTARRGYATPVALLGAFLLVILLLVGVSLRRQMDTRVKQATDLTGSLRGQTVTEILEKLGDPLDRASTPDQKKEILVYAVEGDDSRVKYIYISDGKVVAAKEDEFKPSLASDDWVASGEKADSPENSGGEAGSQSTPSASGPVAFDNGPQMNEVPSGTDALPDESVYEEEPVPTENQNRGQYDNLRDQLTTPSDSALDRLTRNIFNEPGQARESNSRENILPRQSGDLVPGPAYPEEILGSRLNTFTPITLKANTSLFNLFRQEERKWIVVTLDKIRVYDGGDGDDVAEIQFASGGKSGRWYEGQFGPNYLWWEAEDGDWIRINKPIFIRRKDHLEDKIALWVTVADLSKGYGTLSPRSIRNGVEAFYNNPGAFLQAGSRRDELISSYTSAMSQVSNEESEWQPLSTMTVLLKKDDEYGLRGVSERRVGKTRLVRSGNIAFVYTIHEVLSPDKKVNVKLELKKIRTGASGDSYENPGDLIALTQVGDGFRSGGAFNFVRRRFPTDDDWEEKGWFENWEINGEMFKADVTGPVVYLEVVNYDYDDTSNSELLGAAGMTLYLEDYTRDTDRTLVFGPEGGRGDYAGMLSDFYTKGLDGMAFPFVKVNLDYQ